MKEAVSEHSRERQSVSALRKQLVELQAKVAAAHGQLHETQVGSPSSTRYHTSAADTATLHGSHKPHLQDLVEFNRARIQQAAAEASALERRSTEQAASTSQLGVQPELLSSPIGPMVQRQATGSMVRGQPQAQSIWVPAAFSRSLHTGKMITFQHEGQPWLLFRDGSGAAACIEDCCAHRACPLSLVSPSDLAANSGLGP